MDLLEESAIKDIKILIISHKIKLNDHKTEVIFLGTKVRIEQIDSIKIRVGGTMITPARCDF